MAKNLETLARQDGLLEVHITAPQMNTSELSQIIGELTGLGITDHQYFSRVHNVEPNKEYPQPNKTPVVGHDIENPGVMSTFISRDYDSVRRLINKAMQVLASHGKKGNFEVERFISPEVKDFDYIDLGGDFPGHKRVANAPAYENHFEYDAPLYMLPPDEGIIDFIQKKFGTTPHQIVDFSKTPITNSTAAVSRVATIYQPTREEALQFREKVILFSFNQTKNPYISFLTEQVCLVGEPK